MRVLSGLIGAVVGFFLTLFLLETIGFRIQGDPIMTGFLGILIGGLGGAVGVVAATKLAIMRSEGANAPGATAASLKNLALVAALVGVGGFGYFLYSYVTATPWLRPGGIVLQYEVQMPNGTSLAVAQTAEIDLQTGQNSMPFSYHRNKKVIDGDPPMITGVVDLAFRTSSRQLELKIPGQPVRVFPLKLAAEPKHSPNLGAWQKHPDGGEVRYRVRWPGQD